MTADDGIIDEESNPFTKGYWVDQGYRFTSERSDQIEEHQLIGKSVEEIKAIKDRNVGNYLAFIAIRWGFLKIENNRLVTTHKWDDKELYFKKPSKSKVSTPQKATSIIVKPQPLKSHQADNGLEDLESIRKEIERRRKILIDRAHDDSIQMDSVEREHIIEYLEKENLPRKPDTEIQLLKEFVSSALSINQPPFRTRNRLKKILGEIVLGKTVAICLSRLFDTEAFLNNENWKPLALHSLVSSLKVKERDEFKMYVINTIGDISLVMNDELVSGLKKFYTQVDAATGGSPEQAWAFMQEFTREIPGVGPVLMSDFLKNVGYQRFVKIDFHLKREFPSLLSGVKTDAKSLFIYAWHLCETLGMTPFVFDHIMYQWGRAKL